MNRIILAYSQSNAELAQHIDNQLSRIGIPFEHHDAAVGNFSANIAHANEPMLLLITDNLLKEKAAMTGLLDALKKLSSTQTVLPVLADGKDEDGNAVSTQLDRMVNMLHYMNFWQGEWMRLSSSVQEASVGEKEALEKELDVIRGIANQVSDFIAAIRELGAISVQELEARDYALFFQKFDLSDWHGQYKKMAAQASEPEQVAEPLRLPETPVFSGVLAPEPVGEPLPIKTATPIAPSEPEDAPMVPAAVLNPLPTEEEPIEQPAPVVEQIELTIRDAQFWIDRGYSERGLELLKIATEEYPHDERLADAYKVAQAHLEVPAVATSTGTPESKAEEPVSAQQGQTNNVESYELMGDMAMEKGEYLFAKYCWDRVVEVHPQHPGIYRKLGLMTAEHLHDYQETAVHYLNRALEENPGDHEVQEVLADLLQETKQQPEATLEKQPSFPPAEELIPVRQPQPDLESAKTADTRTVLITGATSGIGRATAEIFARNGYRLILTGRRVERLVELQQHLESAYQADVLLLPFDVRDGGAVQAALSSLPESFQEIDVLVNNAGLAKGLSPIHEGSLEHWETMIDTNVKGLLYVTRLIAPGMVARKKGHIINVGSSAGKEVYPNGNVYCATKFAVDALTKAIRFDLHVHNIRVSQVSPGHVEETEFAITRFDGDKERANIYQDFQALKASDVAEVIYFMVTRPAHVNIQDIQLFATQQASSMIINKSGR